MKNFTIIFAVIVMAVLNFENSLVSAQTLNGGVKNHWELELEDGQHPKNPLLQLTGFVPQTRVESKKRNLSRQEFWDFVNGYKKPSKIIPSNPYWASQWTVYAAHGKKQLVFLMKEATRNYSLSDQELVRLFFREANEVLVTDSVLSTGIAYWKKNGVVEGVGWTEKRNFYKTGDGGERMLVFEGEYGVVRFSLTCGNSFAFETKTPPPKPEPPKPKDPIIIPCKKDPIIIPCESEKGPSGAAVGNGKAPIIINGNGTVPQRKSENTPVIIGGNSNVDPRTLRPNSGQQVQGQQSQSQKSSNGMVPATSAGPAKRR